MRKAVENAAFTVTSIVKMKKKAASYSQKIPPKEEIELSPEEEVGKYLAYHDQQSYIIYCAVIISKQMKIHPIKCGR